MVAVIRACASIPVIVFLLLAVAHDPVTAAPQAGATYTGTHAGGGNVSFTVSSDGTGITRFSATNVPGNGCTISEISVDFSPPVAVTGDSFSRQVSQGLSFTGSFSSPTNAAGTLKVVNRAIPGVQPGCESATLNWSASAGSSPPAPTTTPTATPTATLPAAPPAVCAPRPNVRVSAVVSGVGRLQATITAGAGPLRELQFGAATNALIDIGDQAGRRPPFTYVPPPGTDQVTFVVRWEAVGPAAHVPLVVVDACGTWPTFVGGGARTFENLDPGEAATPTVTATPTITPTMARPANDQFDAATTLAAPGTASGDTRQATSQDWGDNFSFIPAEFYLPPCGFTGHTVWYRITPGQAGNLEVNTAGSDFDTLAALYTGTSLSSLVPVLGGCNNDENAAGGVRTSRFSAEVVGGQTYYLQVGGLGRVINDPDFGISYDVSESGRLSLAVSLAAIVPTATPTATATRTPTLVPGTISGTVTDSTTGAPVLAAMVGVNGFPGLVAFTNPTTGQFTLSGVSPGSRTLVTSATGYTTDTRTLSVQPGVNPPLTIALVPTTGTLTGTVTDATTGQPIEGATVSVGAGFPWTQTNAAGQFTLTGVTPGPQTVRTEKTSFVGPGGYVTDTRVVNVAAGSNPALAIALAPLGTVTVTVTNASTTDPLTGAQVSIDGGFPWITNAQGQVTITNVSLGDHSLQVSFPFFTTDTRTITVVSGPNSVAVELVPN